MEWFFNDRNMISYLMNNFLSPRDCLLFSMTCKRFYGLFSPRDRKFLSLDLQVRNTQELSIKCEASDWWICHVCNVPMLKQNRRFHKCRKWNFSEVCETCMMPFSEKGIKLHRWKGCNGRPFKDNCDICHKVHKNHKEYHCIFKKRQCFKCRRILPQHLFNNGKQCFVCFIRIANISLCYKCMSDRCGGHSREKCLFCGEWWDRFNNDNQKYHECSDTRGRVCYNVERIANPQRNHARLSPWREHFSYQGLYMNSNIFDLDAVAIMFVKSVKDIPTLRFLRYSVMIFEESVQLASYNKPGDFMWRIRNVPKCCGWCMSTKEHMYFACSRCKQIFYCSKDCQASDWNAHKYDCLS